MNGIIIKIDYKNMSIEEKRLYHKNKMRELRQSKREYYLKVLRGLPGRFINEKLVFNKDDYKRIKYCNGNNKLD